MSMHKSPLWFTMIHFRLCNPQSPWQCHRSAGVPAQQLGFARSFRKSYVQVPCLASWHVAKLTTTSSPARLDHRMWWRWRSSGPAPMKLNYRFQGQNVNVLHLKPLHWPLSLRRDTIEHLGNKKPIKGKIRKKGKQGHRVAARWKWYEMI